MTTTVEPVLNYEPSMNPVPTYDANGNPVPLCDPGGIMVSGTAFDHLQGKVDFPLEYAGEQQVKNITRPVRAYRARLDGIALPPPARRRRRSFLPLRSLAATAALAVAAIAGSVTKVLPPITPASPASPAPAPKTSMNTRGTLWPSASTISGWVSALWMTSPMRVLNSRNRSW